MPHRTVRCSPHCLLANIATRHARGAPHTGIVDIYAQDSTHNTRRRTLTARDPLYTTVHSKFYSTVEGSVSDRLCTLRTVTYRMGCTLYSTVQRNRSVVQYNTVRMRRRAHCHWRSRRDRSGAWKSRPSVVSRLAVDSMPRRCQESHDFL